MKQELFLTRKSVRSYDPHPLTEDILRQLKDYADQSNNPFGIPVSFVFLDASLPGLTSPVLTGQTMYVTAKVAKVPGAEEAYGYSFERFLMLAWSIGIGSVWIGGTMNRAAFELASDLSPDEFMPCMSPLGFPAKSRSIRETLMRKGVKADDRLPLSSFVFAEDFSRPYAGGSHVMIENALEAVRWAPSAVNKQPWRIVLTKDAAHFFEHQDKGYQSPSTGDLQRIDVGIALYHFVASMEESSENIQVFTQDPGLQLPKDTRYIASVKLPVTE